MTVKRRLSQILSSFRLKSKVRRTLEEVVELSKGNLQGKPRSQSHLLLLEDKDNNSCEFEGGGRENYSMDNKSQDEEESNSSIVVFTQLKVEILQEPNYPPSPILPGNKSKNNLIYSGTGETPCQNTNSKRRGDDRKIEHYEERESIGEGISRLPETYETNASSALPFPSEQKLKRRLSLKVSNMNGYIVDLIGLDVYVMLLGLEV